MTLQLRTDLKKAEGQMATLARFAGELPSDRMYFRYPEHVDITEDFTSEYFLRKEADLHARWKDVRDLLVVALAEAGQRYGAPAVDIVCYLTSLGPYGYFHPPGEVFVNVWDADVDHAIETIAHEALHVILFDQASAMTYQEREQFIDGQFQKGLLAEMFPCYRAQEF